MWGLQHIIIEGVAILLMQKGLGYQALWKTFQVSSCWGVVCVFAQMGKVLLLLLLFSLLSGDTVLYQCTGFLFISKRANLLTCCPTALHVNNNPYPNIHINVVNLTAPPGIYRNAVLLLWFLSMLGFYGVLWLAPRQRLFRRPAVYWYAKFWFFYRLSIMTLYLLEDWNVTAVAANCVNIFIRFLLFALFQPFVTYKALMVDSE